MDERQRLIRQFHAETVAAVRRLTQEIGYRAPRFVQMVATHGAVETARILLRGPETSEGFQILMDHHRLGDSVEAAVLIPVYEPLFSEEERAIARRRPEAHNFPVDAYLRSLSDGDGGAP
jgi:hypothetical protein